MSAESLAEKSILTQPRSSQAISNSLVGYPNAEAKKLNNCPLSILFFLIKSSYKTRLWSIYEKKIEFCQGHF